MALNVLRPLLATDEREVRQHVVQWVQHIRQTPALAADAEERLISVLSQLIDRFVYPFYVPLLSPDASTPTMIFSLSGRQNTR